MKHAQPYANWSRAPALSHLWMAALLRLAAMLVSSAASILRMGLRLLSRECHTDVQPDALPEGKTGTLKKETETATLHSQPTEGLMVSSARSARPSNHEAGLTPSLNESFPGKARSAASPESWFERQWNWRTTAQSSPGDNRDSRDALRLTGNDRCWAWASTPGLRL